MGNYITSNKINNDEKIILTFKFIQNKNTLYFDKQKYVKDAENPYIFASVKPITKIGNYTFANCTGLTKIIIPNSVSIIGIYAFCLCTSLTKIVIPNSVSIIGHGVFCLCTSLTQIAIPNSVTMIGNSAFCCCTSLTDIILPDSVTTINDMGFHLCISLTQLVIPDSVTTISNDVFGFCNALKTIETNNENAYIIKYCKRNNPNIKVLITNEPYVLK